MRIAFDVSPLSHPRTGVGNYIRGSLAGLVEAAGPSTRSSRSRRPARRGSGGSRRRSPASRSSRACGSCPFAHLWRQGWSRVGWPPVERFLGPIDVLHFSDWMYPPQRGGIRSTMVHDLVPLRFPEWVAGPHEADARREVPERRAHLRRDLRQLRSSRRARWSSCSASRRRRSSSPTRASTIAAEGARADLGRPYVLTVATLEPRKNLETLLAAPLPEGHALAVVGAEGWGPQPSLDRPDVIRLGYVDDERARAPLPRRGRVRLPVAVRGVRHSDRRGDGGRRACRRLRAPVAGRGRRRRRRARRPGRPGGDRAPPSRRRCAAATSSSRAGWRTRARFTLGRDRPRHARGVLGMRVGARHVSPLVQTQAGTARYVRALLAHNEYERLSWGGPRDAATIVRDAWWYPHGLPRGGARPRRAALPDVPRPCTRASVPVVVTVHDLAVLRHPETFNQWTRRYSRLAVPRVARAARRVIAVSEFTTRRGGRAARRSRRTDRT